MEDKKFCTEIDVAKITKESLIVNGGVQHSVPWSHSSHWSKHLHAREEYRVVELVIDKDPATPSIQETLRAIPPHAKEVAGIGAERLQIDLCIEGWELETKNRERVSPQECRLVAYTAPRSASVSG